MRPMLAPTNAAIASILALSLKFFQGSVPSGTSAAAPRNCMPRTSVLGSRWKISKARATSVSTTFRDFSLPASWTRHCAGRTKILQPCSNHLDVSLPTRGLRVIFRELSLKGSFLIDLEKREDERGFFARTFCKHEFEAHGLPAEFVQCNISFNKRKGTLRGMHFQAPPHAEAKLIRCTRGSIFDAIIDLRPSSPTFKQHFTVVLSADGPSMLYVSEGFAHGFQTLEDNTEVFYQMSQFHAPDFARGVRWNDPAFGIAWPPADRIIVERDQRYADFGQ